jgi:hypothetical protein
VCTKLLLEDFGRVCQTIARTSTEEIKTGGVAQWTWQQPPKKKLGARIPPGNADADVSF